MSYIVAAAERVDIQSAIETLRKDFGIATLLVKGGGELNGAMRSAGLIDEVSLLLAPGVDGRTGRPSVFDRLTQEGVAAVPLRLLSVEQVDAGVLWIRYETARQVEDAA